MSNVEVLAGIKESVDRLVEKQDEEKAARELATGELKEQLTQALQERDAIIEELRGQIRVVEAHQLPGSEPNEAKGEKFSLSKAISAIANKNPEIAPYEMEIMREAKKQVQRAMGTETDAAGGFMVPEEAIPQVIERLKAETVAFQLGARSMPAMGSPIPIPRLATSATANWITGENTTIPAADQTLEQIQLVPKKLAARLVLSNELLEMATPAVDTFVEDDMVSELSIGLDTGAIQGTGASGQPRGIVNDPNVNTSPATDGQVTYAELVDFITALGTDNALRGQLGWAITPNIHGQLMTVPNAGSVDIERRVLGSGALDRILGYPFRMTTSLTGTGGVGAGSIIFGNWNDLIIAQWGGIRLRSSDSSDDAFSKDQTHIRAIMRADVAVRHPESFCVAS